MNKFLFLLTLLSICFVGIEAQNTYPLPDVPSSLKEPGDRANYLVSHFWEKAPLAKINLNEDESLLEQSFVDFLSVIPYADIDHRKLGINFLMDNTFENRPVFDFLFGLAEKYLYQEDSPMRNDDIYAIFIANLIANPQLSDSEKLRPQFQLEAIEKNHPGQKANDFKFQLIDGSSLSLYDIKSDNDILLMFYDPDCDHCRDTIDSLISNQGFMDYVKNGNLKVVAIYSGDDKMLWEETYSSLPSEWLVGYEDGTLQDEDLYIIRSLPSVYLLDKDKIVKVKEMGSENICMIAK